MAAPDQNTIFREEDLEALIQNSLMDKNYSLDKATKRIFLDLAKTFIDEVLDLPSHEKNNITKDAVTRQISLKFPEISREFLSVEAMQKRNSQIQKEDII